MKNPLRTVGRWLASYLNQPLSRHVPFTSISSEQIHRVLQPADVLLVEGDTRVSTAIKYLTQSTWSHAALYVGDVMGQGLDPETAPTLIEADLQRGVIAVPLGTYKHLNTRICRPVGLRPEDREAVVQYAVARLGLAYDLKNIVDLARYLLPIPPVPTFMRRKMLALGSGDPTRAICTTLIAQAFQSVRYPILPRIEILDDEDRRRCGQGVREILHIRHHSLFAPRDFDLSPYFMVVKPLLEGDFDYRSLTWDDQTDCGRADAADAGWL
ncbi:hypothetical protein TVNIR_1038 [Thioalkalivibrio nitratireducens DSM 14787]|uniref:Lipo-like protein n=1 Tax=Thioalkalivibrio nitratireducens (strain DSM 14787 / UNIQEM 213 / ALEN2) TaxID=1255043 RepID=L0DUN9_THIND|nr:YiiX/YebB-like N1pC/P60 family cysteine hydrolase [Thioalkalivibrio nitratireducens]AGA32722.1 hypothetical protein TVNIR_1038 [Thioalkalivibrio nitratireducens DSM 14787]